MRRFVGLLAILFFALPLGFSVAGCSHTAAVQYCNGSGYGPTTGQVSSIVFASNLANTGESLNYGQIGTVLSASAVDCNDSPVSVSKYVYATTDMSIADINPNTGSVCGGSWNRNTGGGIADYTVCTPPAATNTKHMAYITASAAGAVSNAIAVYIHSPVTAVVLGGATADCSNSTDPGTDCCSTSTTGTTVTAPAYNETSCLSQNASGRLIARVYANGKTDPADNITCQVGHLTFALQGAATVAAVDVNGVATANQPGSALVTATVSNSSSAVNAGFISTCPPASISLSAVSQPADASNITVSINNPQAFSATVKDKNGTVMNGVALEFNSTLPVNFPTSTGTVTPVYPGAATITAVCQPPTCNPAPFSQIGYLGNGKAVTSNGITVTAPGTASDVLYMASTDSQYVASEDFTTGQLGSPLKLPYTPNSLVISQDGTTIYMGSSGGLMTVNTASGATTAAYQAIQGSVLAVAPNNSYAVVTDPVRGTVSLVTANGTVFSTFNGVGTHAQWTPDSTTLYVTTNTNQLLTYSTFVGWESTTIDQPQYNDVAVTVPSYGAFFAGPVTEGRSYCPTTTLASAEIPPIATNTFSPLANQTAVVTDRLTATTDGVHVLGATVTTTPATLEDITPSLPVTSNQPDGPQVCTTAAGAVVFNSSFTAHPLTGVTATAITGVVAASNSSVAAVTYTGSGGVLPLYGPATGKVTNVALSGSAIAPLAGVFSTDNTMFYVGTSGDNLVHLITISGTTGTGTDTGTLAPALPSASGGSASPNLIAHKARRTTS